MEIANCAPKPAVEWTREMITASDVNGRVQLNQKKPRQKI